MGPILESELGQWQHEQPLYLIAIMQNNKNKWPKNISAEHIRVFVTGQDTFLLILLSFDKRI